MNSRIASIVAAVALACGGTAAQALPLGEHASVELFAGGNVGIPGSFSDDSARLGSTPEGNIAFDRVSFDSAYDHRYTGGAEFDYAFDSQLTGFAHASYAKFDGRDRTVGYLFGDNGRTPVNAQFDDTNSRSVDVGARYTFGSEGRLRPFVGFALGATDTSPVRAMIDDPAAGGATRVELARGGAVFEQRLETGLQFSPMPNFDLRLTASAMHLGAQKASDDPNIALLGATPTHDTVGARWDYPAELGAVFHF